MKTVLLIESFYGGSHKQLIDLLYKEFRPFTELFTLPGKKWHWRARTSALYFAQVIPLDHDFRVLFTSSVLNLTELVALREDLAKLHKILYFHENQLLYPVEMRRERDFQYGYNQILSCIVADEVIFNSHFNMESFLKSLTSYFSIMPKPRPKDLDLMIRPKCRVMYFPLIMINLDSDTCAQQNVKSDFSGNEERIAVKDDQLPILSSSVCKSTDRNAFRPLHIVWPHRWEHDKNPTAFFDVLCQLQKENSFQLSVVGESYSEIPDAFNKAKQQLEKCIINWGYQQSRADYLRVLSQADIVVSTAEQEFFGVAMLEAVQCGCYPLCPNRLVYPEIYPEEYLYNTSNQLLKKLKRFCKFPELARNHTVQVDTQKFQWSVLKPLYRNLLRVN